MSAQPDLYDEMQKKLREGLQLLEGASDEDRDRLGLALLKLHGALADCIRFELSQKAPHAVRDASRANWQDLIRYGQHYLEFPESDVRLMSDADRQQQHVSRGGTYAKSRAELVDYAGLVERRCAASGALRNPIQPGLPVRLEAPERQRRPWYVSNWLVIAYAAVLMIFFCIIGLLSYSDTLIDYAKKTFQGISPRSASTLISGTMPPPTVAAANTEGACTIIWVEYPGDLGRKSRATVYEELISDQVKAAGMTPREFYNQVVEHNPILEADDYEFLTGQTYLLPQCR